MLSSTVFVKEVSVVEKRRICLWSKQPNNKKTNFINKLSVCDCESAWLKVRIDESKRARL